jgi:hypothetical protein
MNDQAAFPVVVPADWDSVQNGMSLRDYFAGQALTGMLAGRQPNNAYPLEHLAQMSYATADAMIEARGE